MIEKEDAGDGGINRFQDRLHLLELLLSDDLQIEELCFTLARSTVSDCEPIVVKGRWCYLVSNVVNIDEGLLEIEARCSPVRVCGVDEKELERLLSLVQRQPFEMLYISSHSHRAAHRSLSYIATE